MAVVSLIGSAAVTNNTDVYAISDNVAPATNGALLLVLWHSAGSSLVAPTCEGFYDATPGLTYTLVDSVFGSAGGYYLFAADDPVAIPVPGQQVSVALRCTGDAATASVSAFIQVTGMEKFGAAAFRQIKKTNLSLTPDITLDAAALTGNPVICGVVSEDDAPNCTAPPGFTLLLDDGTFTPNTGISVASRNSGFTGTLIDFGGSPGQDLLIIGFELDASPLAIAGSDNSSSSYRRPRAVSRQSFVSNRSQLLYQSIPPGDNEWGRSGIAAKRRFDNARPRSDFFNTPDLSLIVLPPGGAEWGFASVVDLARKRAASAPAAFVWSDVGLLASPMPEHGVALRSISQPSTAKRPIPQAHVAPMNFSLTILSVFTNPPGRQSLQERTRHHTPTPQQLNHPVRNFAAWQEKPFAEYDWPVPPKPKAALQAAAVPSGLDLALLFQTPLRAAVWAMPRFRIARQDPVRPSLLTTLLEVSPSPSWTEWIVPKPPRRLPPQISGVRVVYDTTERLHRYAITIKHKWKIAQQPTPVPNLFTTTLATTVGQKPFNKTDWPLARGAASTFIAGDAVINESIYEDKPFAQNDWPNPAPLRMAIQFNLPSLNLAVTPGGAYPFNQKNWWTPGKQFPPAYFVRQNPNQLTPAVNQDIINQTDWPLPREMRRIPWRAQGGRLVYDTTQLFTRGAVTIRHKWPTAQQPGPQWNLALTTLAPSVGPKPDSTQTYWQNPKFPTRAFIAWDAIINEAIIEDKPFAKYDWINPLIQERANMTWLRVNLQNNTLAPVVVPLDAPPTYDWQNPRGKPRALSLLTHIKAVAPALLQTGAPFRPFGHLALVDREVPPRQHFIGQSQVVSNLLQVVGQQTEWIVPRGARPIPQQGLQQDSFIALSQRFPFLGKTFPRPISRKPIPIDLIQEVNLALRTRPNYGRIGQRLLDGRVDFLAFGDGNQVFEGHGWDDGLQYGLHYYFPMYATGFISANENQGDGAGVGYTYKYKIDSALLLETGGSVLLETGGRVMLDQG